MPAASIDDVQEILALRDQREAPCRVLLDLLAEKADEISQHITDWRFTRVPVVVPDYGRCLATAVFSVPTGIIPASVNNERNMYQMNDFTYVKRFIWLATAVLLLSLWLYWLHRLPSL